MADLALTAAQIAVVYPEKADIHDMVAAVAITAGQPVYLTSAGKAGVADANDAGKFQFRGIALTSVGAGQGVSVLRRGHIFGFTITQAYDAILYVSDTAGSIADAAGSTTVPVGRVDAKPDSDLTKIIYINARQLSDWA